MADLRDFTGKNRKFTGVSGITVSDGAVTGDRVNEAGRLRFNTTNNLMEYYTGTEWKAIDAPPIVSTIAVAGGAAAASAFIDRTTGGNVTIVIAGSLFDTSSATVLLEATSGANITPASTTINNSSQITIVLPYSDFVDANEPYSVKVTNPSGLSATLADAIYNDTVPTFTNAADTTISIFDGARSGISIAAADLCGATDAQGDTLSYSVTTGALPSGLTMSSATGVITGSVSAVSSNTTSTFTVTVAQTGGGNSASRQFKILVYAPQTSTFTSSGTFTVPTGLTTVDVLAVAGGGGSTYHHDGGGGAGGLIYRPGFTVTPGSPISVTVGAGAAGGPSSPAGADSVFSTLTAKGGGSGTPGGQAGGSGSGGYHGPGPNQPGKPGTQPSQPGDSGTYGFGNPGGNGFYTSPPTGAQGGGGGGAGAAGGNAQPNTPGSGGAGRQYDISGSNVYYAGGGAGGGHQNATGGSGGIGGGGNAGSGPGAQGNDGTANRGGGAGGGNDSGSSNNQSGGSGIVIVKY